MQFGFEARKVPFRRPANSVFFRIGNAFMPPQPTGQVRLSFGDIRRHFKFHHYVISIGAIAVFFGIVTLEIELWEGLRLSPITATIALVSWAYNQGIATFLLTLTGFVCLFGLAQGTKKRNRHDLQFYEDHTVGLLSKAAVKEEQWFREGSENWTWRQRLRSCFCFGFVHMANLFYPFASILPLGLVGLLFMHIYLRTYRRTHDREAAVLASSVAHRLYNRIALIVIGIVIGIVIIIAIIDLL